MTADNLVTNQGGNTLLAALEAALPGAVVATRLGLAEAQATMTEISIATGFVSAAGFGALAQRLDRAEKIRLLLGVEPEPEAWRIARRPGDPPPVAWQKREVARGLEKLEAGLRRARDALPFTTEARDHLRATTRLLRAEKLETRRYERAFLHAKAMLLDGLDPGLIVGSSNLSRAGLTANLELNLGSRHAVVLAQARAWFDALWDTAEPFDLAAFFEEPEAEFAPWLIFLRILWQLYGEEVEQERMEAGVIPLTAFQLHGVWRAQRILREYGGVIVADEVGLGKTFIAGEILSAASRRFQRALLVCPAALRDTTWKRFLDTYGFSRFVDMVSYDELGRDHRLADARRPPSSGDAKLRFDPEDYALVVVDEAHNYRNPDAPNRAAVLRRLLAGQRKQLVLLTATPVNNSLWDLFHLLRLFLRQDAALVPLGVVSVAERFKAAARQDPSALDPDFLYPIIDAITVKRTRAFVKRHYAGETIRGADGVARPIVFPQAVAITVRYALDSTAPGLFHAVADALDPVGGTTLIAFARYAPDRFLLRSDADAWETGETAAGLLRSGLLKRFESSAHAFGISLARMLREHDVFMDALARGKVVTTALLREMSADEDALEDLLGAGTRVADAGEYDVPALRDAVARDRAILQGLTDRLAATQADPKLAAVVDALASIGAAAHADAATEADERRNRKVLVFSYFADTVAWLRQALERHIATDPRLAPYRGRIVAVAGGGLEGEEASRSEAVWGFAPESSDPPAGQAADRFDLLITTDVLAEGMNLQQCRNIVNYDLPWNPMRLVQRHGRIDRIGSPHRRVFLRTIFPADRLDALLALEARILRKLTQAARSIGVATLPVDGPEAGLQVFAETRAEIERLAAGDASLFDQAGGAQTGGAQTGGAQTGEEYRHRLRAALLADRRSIVELPGRAGSGMRHGRANGVLFCAEVEMVGGRRNFLRFVPADVRWQPADAPILRETGTCLRLVDCTEATPRAMPAALGERVFGFWDRGLADILSEWDHLSDPANLQPTIRPLNRQVAAFLRAHPPHALASGRLAEALDILEAPWPRREEALLREQVRDRAGTPAQRSRRLADWVLASGLEPFAPPAPLPPITAADVRLVCWMALDAG